jgi:riboflavin biosynthesis pyrimidine reductase
MKRPRIITHSHASLDGRLTLAADVLLLNGDERWQAVAGAGDDAYRLIQETFKPQAMLEGSGSLVLDGQLPEPLPPFDCDAASLYTDFLPDAVVRVVQRKWLTVVDGRGRIRWMYKEFPGEMWQGWYVLVLVCRTTPPEYLAYLRRENIPYLVSGEGHVDLPQALEKMLSQLGVTCVVSTAGGKLNGALLRTGLIDEVSVEFFPALIGGFDTPSLFDSRALGPSENPTRLRLFYHQIRENGHVWLRYQVVPNGTSGTKE